MPNFLDLPRELRDQIYKLNLIHGTIPISTSNDLLHTSYGSLRHVDGLYQLCGCNSCASTRGTGLIRRDTKRTMRKTHSTYQIVTSTGVRIENIQKSYDQPETNESGFVMGFKKDLSKLDARSLTILLSNRQIYREASEVFYACNRFDFGCSERGKYCDSLSNAFGFLKDRSEHTLKRLKSIRLALGGREKDKLWEESWPEGHELQTLCDILGNKCQLAELTLGIFGTSPSGELHPCLEQLYRITRLRILNI